MRGRCRSLQLAGGVVGVGTTSDVASGEPLWSALLASGAVSANVSRRWYGAFHRFASRLLVRSATVSVAAQKYGGDSVHPMGRTRGKASSHSFPTRVGIEQVSFGMLLILSQMQ
jgi:hypothetical protein